MLLTDLLAPLASKEIRGTVNPQILGLTQDSRLVQPGYVFVCILGYQRDGHDYIKEAKQRGAVAIIIDREWPQMESFPSVDLPVLVKVGDSRQALALMSAAFYGQPSSKLRLIGITGTNGKTTTTYLVASILEAAHFEVGLMNTLTCRIGREEISSVRTTPESVDLQKALASMVEVGCQYGVIEISSHALALNRVLGCECDVGILTNITPDHLDFHQSFAEYQLAKQRLFANLHFGEKPRKRAILNLDDPSFAAIKEQTQVPIFSYGLQDKADIFARKVTFSAQGLAFEACTPAGALEVRTSLSGKHNVYNILAAIGAGLAEGVGLDQIRVGIQRVTHVPGRFETISCGQDFWVVVDFAHTPDALRKLLEAGRSLKPRRIITVFGCGGDRDTTKRFPMGQIAASYSDQVIITNDNARSENPEAIARQIEEGARSILGKGEIEREADQSASASSYEIILDRHQAIEKALLLAGTGDLVLIAGKGHEQYQIIGSQVTPFDDRRVARALLNTKMEKKKGKEI